MSSITGFACLKMYKLQCPHLYCPITFKTQRGRTYHIRTVHSRPLNHPNDVQHNDQEHEDQHLQHGSDDGNFAPIAPMENDLQPVEQRKEHPHLTGMCTTYFVENVQTIKLTNSTSMRPEWQFPATRHPTSTTNGDTTRRLESF